MKLVQTKVARREAELDRPARRPAYCALSNRKLAETGIEMPRWEDAVGRYARRLRARVSPTPSG